MDQGSNAAIFARGHKPRVFDVRLGDEHRIGVKAIEHGFDGGFVQLTRVDFVDIVEVQLTEEAVVDVEALGDFEVILLLLGEEAEREQESQD